MDFQCTQVIEDDDRNEPPVSDDTDDKIQIGTLEFGNTKHVILKGFTKVGRHPACDIYLKDNTVSKFHAEIEANGQNVFVCDRESSNKTRMNDAILLPSRFYEVRDGASLKFGIVEGRFFLKRPEDRSVLAPETPEATLRLRIDTSGENSLVEATPNPRDDVNFRRPAVPSPRRTRIPYMGHQGVQTVPDEDIQSAETQVESPEDISNLETQFSSLQNDNFDIQNMETQILGGKNAPKNPKNHHKIVMNIQEMETQAVNQSEDNYTPENLPTTSKNISIGVKNIQEIETQRFNVEKSADVIGDTPGPSGNVLGTRKNTSRPIYNIQDLETQRSDPKEDDEPSESAQNGFPGEKLSIHDLQTQKFHLEDDEKPLENPAKRLFADNSSIEDLETQRTGIEDDTRSTGDVPGPSTRLPRPFSSIQDLETQRSDFNDTNNSPRSAFARVNRLPESSRDIPTSQSSIHDLQTQVNDPDDDLQATEKEKTISESKKLQKNDPKRLSEFKNDLKTLQTDIFGTSSTRSSDDDDDEVREIYDLPTQTNFDYSEAEKRKNKGKNDEIEVSRDSSPSPDLVTAPAPVIIDESDVETDEEGIFNNSLFKIKGDESKNGEKEVKNDDKNLKNDDKNLKNSDVRDDDKHRNNTRVISDSDDDDDENLRDNYDKKSKNNSDKFKFRKNGIVSDSDSDDDVITTLNNSSRCSGGSRGAELSDKNGEIGIFEDKKNSGGCSRASGGDDTNVDEVLDSGSETDYDDNDKRIIRSPKSSEMNESVNKEKIINSGDDTDFEGVDNSSKMNLKSSKNDFKNSKSSKLISEGNKNLPESSGDETDYEGALIDLKKTQKSLKSSVKTSENSNLATHVISDSSDDEKIPEKSVTTSKISSASLESPRSPRKSISVVSQEPGNEKCLKNDIKNSKSSKSPQKSSRVINGGSLSRNVHRKLEKSLENLLNSSESDSDDKSSLNAFKLRSKSSKNNFKNSKKSSSTHKNPLDGVNTSDVPPEILEIMKSSVDPKNNNSEDDEDSDTAQTQLIVQPKPSENSEKTRANVPEKSLGPSSSGRHSYAENSEEIDEDLMPTQKIDLNSMKNRKNQDIDDLAPTQIIPTSSGPQNAHDDDYDDDDLQPTQKINFRGNSKLQKKNISNFFDDSSPTQVININNTPSIMSSNVPGPSKALGEDPEGYLPATQVINDNKTKTQSSSNDSTSKKRSVGDADALDDVQTKKIKSDDLDDTDSTQIIDINSSKVTKSSKIPKIVTSISKNPKNVKKKSSKISSLDSEDSDKSPKSSRVTRSRNDAPRSVTPSKKLEIAENFDTLVTSTPLTPTPAKKRKFNLSLRGRKNGESKESGFNESKSDSNDKSSQNNQKTDDDSISKNLDSMFGGHDDDKKNIGGTLMTQQLVDILEPSQSPPESLKSIKTSKKSLKSKNNDGKTLKRALAVEDESQDNCHVNLRTKRRKNILGGDSSDDEKPISGFDKGVAVQIDQSISSSSRKSSRIQRNLKDKKPLKSVKDLKTVQMSPKPSTSKQNQQKDGKLPGIEMCVTSCPVSSRISLKNPLNNPDASKGPSESFQKSPRRLKSMKSRFPKISIKKIDKKTVDSSDEDLDFESINAMADGYLTSSKIQKSPGRSKKPLSIAKSSSKTDSSGKIDKNEEITKTPKRRGRKKLEKNPDLVEEGKKSTSEDVSKVLKVSEVGKKRGRSKKNEDEEVESKRRRDESRESSPGIESQEVRRILQGAEGPHEKKVEKLEEVVKGIKKGKGKGKKKNLVEDLEGIVDSPSKAVRSRSFFEESKEHCVLFTGVKDAEEGNTDSVIALGGTVTSDPHVATVLVTDKVRRTVKFFCAVARGIPIVSIDWLTSSMSSKKFLDPNKYILEDPSSESRFRFSLSKSLTRARNKKLLEGRTVILTPKLMGPSIPVLKIMVQVSGGKAMARGPNVWTDGSIIVTCREDMPKVEKMLAKAQKVQVHVVSIEFLLSGILRQQLDFEEFTLRV